MFFYPDVISELIFKTFLINFLLYLLINFSVLFRRYSVLSIIVLDNVIVAIGNVIKALEGESQCELSGSPRFFLSSYKLQAVEAIPKNCNVILWYLKAVISDYSRATLRVKFWSLQDNWFLWVFFSLVFCCCFAFVVLFLE